MPPLRFLHAAGLDLDAGLPTPPAGLADLFASAPLAAVRRLVTRAVELEVDFLLVTPADGPSGGPSSSAEAALRSEFDRLIEHGITVFLAVESRDAGWERLAGHGSDVVLLASGSFAPVANRNGMPVGILRCTDRPIVAEQPVPPGPEDSLELAVAPRSSAADVTGIAAIRHDYLALGCGPRETVALSGGVAHAPGRLQATDTSEIGPHGATLVTLEEDGTVRTEFVPTAAVRFEAPEIAASPNDVVEDLAMRMAERIGALKPEPCEAAWVVRWQIDAGRSISETLSTPSGQSDLTGLLPEKVGDAPVVHEVILRSARLRAVVEDGFATEFEKALKKCEVSLVSTAARLALTGVADGGLHRERLCQLLAAADATGVIGSARRLGVAIAAAAASETDGD